MPRISTNSHLDQIGSQPSRRAFTLLEMLVATSIFTIVLAVSIGIFGQISGVWRRSVEKVKSFQSARISFDLITRNVGQANLNTFLDYMDSSDRFPADSGYDNRPVRYARRSSLQFVCAQAGTGETPGTPGTGTATFFQVPAGYEGTSSDYVGLDNLLNACGYYIEFADDTTRPQHTEPKSRYRYRLMQLMVPTQKNAIFKAPETDLRQWFEDYAATYAYPVAENIIALILVPRDPVNPISDDFEYDSRLGERNKPQPVTANQMPPVVQVTMVAIDDNSALRMDDGASEPGVIRSALSGKFESVANFEKDLDDLKTALADAKINYQVFSSAVPIRESKWTKD